MYNKVTRIKGVCTMCNCIFKFLTLSLVIMITASLWSTPPQASAAPNMASLAQTTETGSLSGGPIIADHTVVDLYDDIPQTYIDEVKKMWVTVPGESHSEAYRRGSELLEIEDDRFQVNITTGGTPEEYTDQYLRLSRATWGDVGHDSGWRYGYGEEDWYTSELARQRTMAGITYANTTADLPIAAMGFGWCWDMTWHNEPGGDVDPVYQVRWAGSSVGGPEGDLRWGLDAGDEALTGNSVNMDTYINATEEYIAHSATQGYPTIVFFTTGPVDGNSNTGERGYQRYLKHERIRNHVLNSGDRILFDYADILAWANDGSQNLISWTDHAGSEQTFPRIHDDNMRDLDGNPDDSVGHIGERGAVRLSQALWWMLARISGWDGVTGRRLASTTSGNWDSTDVWGTSLPEASDGVTITTGTTVNVNVNAQVTSLFIEPGAQLIIPDEITLNVRESFLNNGTIQMTRQVNNDSVNFQINDGTRGITRYRMIDLSSSNSLGAVTVTIDALNDGERCVPDGTHAQRCFEIEAENNAPATLRLWAFDDEAEGITNTLQIYRYVESDWVGLTTLSSGTQQGYTYVEADTPGFSDFLIGGSNAPTAIYLLEVRTHTEMLWQVSLLIGISLIAFGVWHVVQNILKTAQKT